MPLPPTEKKTEQLTIRLGETLMRKIDQYVEQRWRTAKVVLSRSHAARELIEQGIERQRST